MRNFLLNNAFIRFPFPLTLQTQVVYYFSQCFQYLKFLYSEEKQKDEIVLKAEYKSHF